MTLTQAILPVVLTSAAGVVSLLILALWLGRYAGAHREPGAHHPPPRGAVHRGVGRSRHMGAGLKARLGKLAG